MQVDERRLAAGQRVTGGHAHHRALVQTEHEAADRAGRSVRNEISVEPGLPKIVVRPCRRMTSKAASRTVRPADERLPLPRSVAGSTPAVWLIAADPTRRPAISAPAPCVLFACRTAWPAGAEMSDKPTPNSFVHPWNGPVSPRGMSDKPHTELGFRAVPGAGARRDPGVRCRAPRAGPQRGGALDRPDPGGGTPVPPDAGQAGLRELRAGPLLVAPARARVGIRLPVEPHAARGRDASHGRTRGPGERVVLDLRAR